jgi:hypothetical protein
MPSKIDNDMDDHPERPIIERKKRAYRWKPKKGKPALEEWEAVSRKVFIRLNEMLDAVDEDGKTMCTPALLTAASRLVIESETLFKVPEVKSTTNLTRQLKHKREKRAERPVMAEMFTPPVRSTLGFTETEASSDDPNTQLRGARLHLNAGETE